MSISKPVLAVSTALAIATSAVVPVATAQNRNQSIDYADRIDYVPVPGEEGINEPWDPNDDKRMDGRTTSDASRLIQDNVSIRCEADGVVTELQPELPISSFTMGRKDASVNDPETGGAMVAQEMALRSASFYDQTDVTLTAIIEQTPEFTGGQGIETAIPVFFNGAKFTDYSQYGVNTEYLRWADLQADDNFDVSFENNGKTTVVSVTIKNFSEDSEFTMGIKSHSYRPGTDVSYGRVLEYDATIEASNDFGNPCPVVPVTETVTATPSTVTETATATETAAATATETATATSEQ